MNCTELRMHLDDYLDGAADAGLVAAIELHLSRCDECAVEVEQARAARADTSGPVAGDTAPVDAYRSAADRPLVREPSGAGRLVAASFVAVFALSIATVIYTGLKVEAPRREITAGLPMIDLSAGDARVVNLVFSSVRPVEEVTLLVVLPAGVELAGYPGERRIAWSTALQSGRNVLPLELTASDAPGGQLVAELSVGDESKVFRVHLNVDPEPGQANGQRVSNGSLPAGN